MYYLYKYKLYKCFYIYVIVIKIYKMIVLLLNDIIGDYDDPKKNNNNNYKK